jgi:dTDP-4-dehydrorhamnose 3,5-epimerase
MIFTPTLLAGAFVIEPELNPDRRGFFARTYCRTEFSAHHIELEVVQSSIAFNAKRGTLRGLHYQSPPFEEAKLVYCPKGGIFDVIVDLRPGSPTRYQWAGFELNESNHRMLFAPAGVAHGYQTLEDDTTVFYQISEAYHPECARGLRWNDPAIGIIWPPIENRVISVRDREFPLIGITQAQREP